MNNNDLQIENGNYTRIVNRVIEELVKTPLLGAELAICLFIIRKTYGYSKTEDQISLTQFEDGVKRSRPTITKALKNLQLVNILQLVKTGNSKISSNVWKFNKYYDTWKVVNTPKLVKDRTATSKEKLIQLVKTPKHTKDNTKDNTKPVAEATIWNFETELKKLKDSVKRKDYKIIALYWKKKNWVFENQEQFNSALVRELKPAKNLKGYKGEEIALAIKHCENNYPEWTLETVHRRITDLVNTKK